MVNDHEVEESVRAEAAILAHHLGTVVANARQKWSRSNNKDEMISYLLLIRMLVGHSVLGTWEDTDQFQELVPCLSIINRFALRMRDHGFDEINLIMNEWEKFAGEHELMVTADYQRYNWNDWEADF